MPNPKCVGVCFFFSFLQAGVSAVSRCSLCFFFSLFHAFHAVARTCSGRVFFFFCCAGMQRLGQRRWFQACCSLCILRWRPNVAGCTNRGLDQSFDGARARCLRVVPHPIKRQLQMPVETPAGLGR